MNKIPTLFLRDENDRKHVTREVNSECQWVLDGEGTATRKYDGTCCLVRNGKLFKRYEARWEWQEPSMDLGGDVGDEGWKSKRPIPDGFIQADAIDENTGKQPGWLPVGDGPDDQYHREAWRSWQLTAEVEPNVSFPPSNGTYELVGPKVQGNVEGYSSHVLISHATETAFDDGTEPPAARDYDSLRKWINAVAKPNNIEGIVWHHPDNRMAKLKTTDLANE